MQGLRGNISHSTRAEFTCKLVSEQQENSPRLLHIGVKNAGRSGNRSASTHSTSQRQTEEC